MIVLIFFTICQGTLLVMNYMLFPGIPSVWNQIGIPAAAISLFTEMALIVNCYRNSKNKILEQEKERLELELNREKLEVESAQMQSERLNRRREDLLRIVKAAENDLHTEERGSAAEKIRKEIEKNRAGQYCANMILNVLLEEYEIRCQKMNIRLSVDALVGELPGISRLHQCSILSNLMNNAMEAVGYLPENKREIRVDIHVRADYLVVTVENPFAEEYIRMEKSSERGYGSRILQEIAQIYDGNCNVKIDMEKRIYKSTVILNAAGIGIEGERGRTA